MLVQSSKQHLGAARSSGGRLRKSLRQYRACAASVDLRGRSWTMRPSGRRTRLRPPSGTSDSRRTSGGGFTAAARTDNPRARRAGDTVGGRLSFRTAPVRTPRQAKESTMKGQAQPYQPLTSENAALVLVDHQVGLMTGVRDYSTGELKHNVVALAKAAKALKLPIVVTTTARDSMWGPTFPELVEALPGMQIIDRSTVNAWDDPKVAAAIEATGRKKLIIAGISLEVCAAFPAITAIGKGYDAYVDRRNGRESGTD